jgi:hypothetical protein
VEKEDQARLERAFLLGMIHGYIRVTDDAGRKVWMYRSGKQTALIKVAGRDVVARLPDLLEALGHNPGIVKKVIELAELQSRDDMRDHPQDLDRHQFLAGCLQSPNILERLLAYPSQAIRDDTVLGEAAALLGRLLEELHQHLRDAYGAGREPAADAECRRVVERLIAESPTWQEGLKNPDRVFDAWQAVVDGFRDTLER